MAWDGPRILGLWTSHRDLLDDGPDYLRKYVDGFAAVATLIENAYGTIDDQAMALAILNSAIGDNPEAIRAEFINELGGKAPPGATTVPFLPGTVAPVAPRPPDAMPGHLGPHLVRLRQMRTSERARRGSVLAGTAVSLLGRWRWVQRMPDSILPYRGVRTNDTGYTDINAFDRWVRDGGTAPTGTTALNCRDAVVVTAREAALLSHGQLRVAYLEAEAKAKDLLGPILNDMQRAPATTWSVPQSTAGSAAYVAYVQCIDQRLTAYHLAVPVSVEHGLIPQPGDLVFVRGTPPAHVCISLGRAWVGGQPVDAVASLWHHDGGRFTRATLGDMGPQDDLRFVPCPF